MRLVPVHRAPDATRFTRVVRLRSAAAVSVLLVSAVLCLAIGTAVAKTVLDANDSNASLDISSVSVTKTVDGALRMKITTVDTWQPSGLRVKSGPPSSLCFNIWTKRKAGTERPDYQLCAAPTADGRKLRGVLVRVRASGAPRRIVAAEVDRPDDKSAALEIFPRRIESPRSFRFTAQTTVTGSACPAAEMLCEDFAPSRGATAIFRMR